MWDRAKRIEYRRLYYKVIIKKIYDICEYNRFLELSGDDYSRQDKISLNDIEKPITFKCDKKKIIITFD